ncbi:unnamed protein product [Clonostachys rhizophaga]|uniref:ML-like domain-containing protein n=1 Tax=Clonostachys rhizophaga TaxID=160324 RepID=A0A9N9V626_9HYPO|nr:unnamed protein product [Clonostachys rhizophaga]
MVATRFPGATVLLSLVLSTFLRTALAKNTAYIQGTGIDGVQRNLDVSRYPALYTQDFDDCLQGQSLFNITKFDAAYYADNLTVVFHLDGVTNVRNENLVLYLNIEAYGISRFNISYDPCKSGIDSMCPLNSSIPVSASAIIPVTADQVAEVPSIALDIPDVEGFARLHVFANSSRTEIGCFQAALTNGQTFSQPHVIGSILGAFTFFAVVASFVTAAYGVSLTHMRTHYAHSFSVLVLFETFQSIFFSGALTLSWPSVLPAWWSNFAWSAGMFTTTRITHAILPFTGNFRNVSQVGGAGWIPLNNRGGLARQIYGRDMLFGRDIAVDSDDSRVSSILLELEHETRYNASDPYAYNWNGGPKIPGLPLPGTWPGFGGVLSVVNMPMSEAFIIGIIWIAVVAAAVVVFIAAFKLILELLAKFKLLKTDGFDFFRSHWAGYIGAGVFRTLFIAFSVVMVLTLRQFALAGPAGPTAIAAVVFALFLFGLGSIAAYACMFRLRRGKFEVSPDTIRLERGFLFQRIPFVAATRSSKIDSGEPADQQPPVYLSLPFLQINFIEDEPHRPAVHHDEHYIKRFGWLFARYRRSRWWYFLPYMIYQFVRACFIGGAAASPLAQVYGLFIVELLAVPLIIKLSAFESNRNIVVSAWMLSISKIITTGLSIAFLPDFDLNRTATTVLGFIIIVVQAFLSVAVLVLVILGAISSWMSLTRNSEQFPEKFECARVTYFEHIAERSKDNRRERRRQQRLRASQQARRQHAPTPAMTETPAPSRPQSTSSFTVGQVRRVQKLEELAANFPAFEQASATYSGPSRTNWSRSRASSTGSRSSGGGGVPSAADNYPGRPRSRAHSTGSRYSNGSLHSSRSHRASWSSKDVGQWDAEMNKVERAESWRKSLPRNSLRFQPLTVPGMPLPGGRPMSPARESMEDEEVKAATAADAARHPSRISEAEDEDNKRLSAEHEPRPVSPLTPSEQEGPEPAEPSKASEIH